MKEKGFWEGAQAAVPTALGYVSIGLACGIIGAPYVTPVEMGLMSLFVYAGSAQFAIAGLNCSPSACGCYCHDGLFDQSTALFTEFTRFYLFSSY